MTLEINMPNWQNPLINEKKGNFVFPFWYKSSKLKSYNIYYKESERKRAAEKHIANSFPYIYMYKFYPLIKKPFIQYKS